MSTNAKIIFGYKDQYGHWTVEKEFVRWADGYSEMVLPQLKEFTTTEKGVDVEAFNNAMKYNSWKLEDITENSYQYGQMNYHYYIDESNRAKIRCTVLKEDSEFFNKYNVMNMVVEQELILND